MLGLLWEDAALRDRLVAADTFPGSVRGEIEAGLERRAKTPTNVDLPLSEECKRVLNYAAREADRLDHKHIGTEHLVLGILVAQKSFTAGILRRHGLDLSRLRQELEKGGAGGAAPE